MSKYAGPGLVRIKDGSYLTRTRRKAAAGAVRDYSLAETGSSVVGEASASAVTLSLVAKTSSCG